MTRPELNRDYIGPLGRIYRVERIDDANGGIVVIRQHPDARGSITFPIAQTWAWLKQVPQANEAAE